MKTAFLVSASILALCGYSETNSTPADSVRYRELVQKGRLQTGEERLKHLEEAVKIYAQDGDLWLHLAQSRLSAKQFAAAESAYRTALKLGAFQPKFRANIAYDLACASALQGKKDKAFEHLEESMQLGFRDLEHLRTDEDLSSLHSDKRWETLAATKDVSKMSRIEGWRYDLWLLTREVQRIHFDPYRHYSKKDQEAWAKQLSREIGKLTDAQISVEFAKYMRRIGDGHTSLRISKPSTKVLPVQIYNFSEGTYITAADKRFEDLAGAKILSIEGKKIADLMPVFDLIAAQDNSQGLLSRSSSIAINPYVLSGLGIAKTESALRMQILDRTGKEREITLPADSDGPNPQWALGRPDEGTPLYLKNLTKPYWFEHLPDQKALYFQYNAVREDPNERIAEFSNRMFEFIEKNDIQRLIVDARWNGGGNSFLNRSFVNGIIGCKKINQPDHLFVIAGRQTFSAAQNFVTDIERACDAVFVGEPTGSAPNFVGETIRFTLPYSKLTGSISDLYWQRSWPIDHRNWIAPDLPAEPSFELYKTNRDPALEAILEYIKSR